MKMIPCKFRIDARDGLDEIFIEERRRPDGPPRWSISGNFGVLNKKFTWEYESMPSSRTDAFFKRCRYDSYEEAFEHLQKLTPKNCKHIWGFSLEEPVEEFTLLKCRVCGHHKKVKKIA